MSAAAEIVKEEAVSAATLAAITRACARIAPLWPLRSFVAVNPFLGFADQSFAATSATLRRVTRVDMLMPRDYYREALDSAFILDEDLGRALAEAPKDWGTPLTPAGLRTAARAPAGATRVPGVVATVAEVLDSLAAGDRQASRTAFMVDEISKWCAAYFDDGQAIWRQPFRNLPPYAAWRAAMRHDLNPEMMGVLGFRQTIASLPEDPLEAIEFVVRRLGLPERALEDYLHRALFDVGGWAAYARYLVWQSELNGGSDDTLVQILAIRLAWGYALFVQRLDAAFRDAWGRAMKAAAALPVDARLGDDPDLAIDLILQQAYEAAWQRRLLGKLSAGLFSGAPRLVRPAVQAAFCIDVRSEVYRRSLEGVSGEIETLGFAGFFGFPIEYVPIGNLRGGAQCPVLLKPAFVVCESVADAGPDEETEILGLRLLRRRASKAWKAFKLSAVSSFTYVETAGLLFALKLFGDSAGITRPVPHPDLDGLDTGVRSRIGPRLESRTVGGRSTGFNAEERVSMAGAVLRAMSMTGNFARLVLLTGHGSTTVNNPHAAGLDCGACGGHTGEANARVAAAILNDPDVRAGLRDRDISIPEDTWFIGCLHDTTTDEVRLCDEGSVPATHAPDIAKVKAWLARASSLARRERSPRLGVAGDGNVDRQVTSRSRDWSQVRPEWGLAGNAVFIAAPRERTSGVDLGGRAFLHNYDWRSDAGFGVLELIMTAPMVVASWINLQYYGSTVNNRAFGSGNKVLHNVVGTVGVLEGNAGDLKAGLPWQSVHDGQRFVHEPLRLNVFIEAPEEEINRIIAKHDAVRQLVDNGWIHLFALDGEGRSIRSYQGSLQWRSVGSPQVPQGEG